MGFGNAFHVSNHSDKLLEQNHLNFVDWLYGFCGERSALASVIFQSLSGGRFRGHLFPWMWIAGVHVQRHRSKMALTRLWTSVFSLHRDWSPYQKCWWKPSLRNISPKWQMDISLHKLNRNMAGPLHTFFPLFPKSCGVCFVCLFVSKFRERSENIICTY